MKTKLSKKVVSLVMALSMLLTLTTMINVSAADDGILVDLDMNSIPTNNEGVYQFGEYGIESWGGATLSVSDRSGDDKYLTAKGVVAFPFDEKLASDIITANFEIKSVKDNWTDTSIWIGSNDCVVRTLSTSELTKTWTKYTLEADFRTGEVKIYKAGSLFDTVTVESLKGTRPQYIGFTRWTVGLEIDNVEVISGLNSIYADYDMSSQSDIIAGGGATITVADGVLTGKAGYTIIPFNRPLVSGKYTVDFELKVPNGNNGVSLFLMNNTNDETNAVKVKDWSWSGEAPNFDWTKFTMEIDVEGKTVKLYKAGTLNVTLENVENLGIMKYVRFVRWGEAVMLKSFTAKKAGVEFVSASFADVKNIKLLFNGTVATSGITVTDSTGAVVNCAASFADNTLTLTTDGYFKAGETYTVSGIKDIYGNAIDSVSLNQNLGSFADYKMNKEEGFAETELAAYEDASLGTYYTSSTNGAKGFPLSNTVKSGVIIVEYDINSVTNPANYNSLILRFSDGDVVLKKHGTWTDTGVWKHYKHIVDLDSKTITTYKEGKQEGDPVSYEINDGTLTNILLSHYHAGEVRLDNLAVSREKISIPWTRPYGEQNGQWKDDLTTYVPTFVYVPFSKVVLGVSAPEGYIAEITPEGNACMVRCEKGYYPAGTTNLTITYWDEYGFTYTRDLTVDAADIYAKIKGISVNGTTATANFSLLKNKDLPTVEYIVAAYDSDGILVNAKSETKTYGTVADDQVSLPLDVSMGYSSLRAFMWDGNLVPLTAE